MTKESTPGIPANRQGKVRSWSEMNGLLDEFEISPQNKKFLRTYFRAQKFIAEGKPVKAKRLFGFLRKFTDYEEFEDGSPFLFAIVDIAVKGKTRWEV